MIMSEGTEKLKHAFCRRCGHEEGIKYEDRYKKVCPVCLKNDSVLQKMSLFKVRFTNPDEPGEYRDDCKDWNGEKLGEYII